MKPSKKEVEFWESEMVSCEPLNQTTPETELPLDFLFRGSVNSLCFLSLSAFLPLFLSLSFLVLVGILVRVMCVLNFTSCLAPTFPRLWKGCISLWALQLYSKNSSTRHQNDWKTNSSSRILFSWGNWFSKLIKISMSTLETQTHFPRFINLQIYTQLH